MFDLQRNRLLNALDEAHDAYHRAEPFRGPSAYFHSKALEAARTQDFEQFVDYAYAMLAAWGMHRMGKGGSKMREYQEFRDSLSAVWPIALTLQAKTPNALSQADWRAIKKVFCGIRCMASGTSLIGNSKVMAHLLPNLIPPVDRRYTLRFLFGKNTVKNAIESEWRTLEQITSDFFTQFCLLHDFRRKQKRGSLTIGGVHGTPQN